jgi:hypothetical protein
MVRHLTFFACVCEDNRICGKDDISNVEQGIKIDSANIHKNGRQSYRFPLPLDEQHSTHDAPCCIDTPNKHFFTSAEKRKDHTLTN